MKSELQNELVRKYPEFFEYLKEYKGTMILPMHFGFECDDGWYWLINNLMDTIHSYCKHNDKPYPDISQIKEKYGGLSFNIYGGNEMIYGMIWLAEHLSHDICETCGSTKNVTQTEGWIKSLCPPCKYKYLNHYRRLKYYPLWLLRLKFKIRRFIKNTFK